jgi:predicted TIM-barrel fold metal-dependent hydrolase
MIDSNMYPHFISEICVDPERVEFRKTVTGIYKPRIVPLTFALSRMDYAGISKSLLHALDLTTTTGQTVVSNEEIRTLIDLAPDRFFGLASVDPFRKDALEVVESGFRDLKLHGLKLDPGKQYFYPNDSSIFPIYELCIRYNRPVVFQGGISLEPQALAKYTQPIYLDDVLVKFPGLRVGLTNFGWPWTRETSTLMLKHPNLYADTALLYFDSADEFYPYVLKNTLGPLWIDRALSRQVMFGTCSGHFNQIRQAKAIRSVDFRPQTMARLLEINVLEFLGLEVGS